MPRTNKTASVDETLKLKLVAALERCQAIRDVEVAEHVLKALRVLHQNPRRKNQRTV